MAAGFHARKSATGRRYRYVVGTDDAAASPFRRPYEWALGRELDLEAMRRAAAGLAGEHDFRAFAVRTPKPHYRARCGWRSGARGPRAIGAAGSRSQRTGSSITWCGCWWGPWWRSVSAAARRATWQALLARQDNDETSPPAPPQGLYFLEAEYPERWFLKA